MSYPQPDSNAPVTAGQDFFRLNTPLVSPGDIYETAVGARAFAVGPDSDIANIAIDYYDETRAPTFVNSVAISPARSMVGTIPSSNDRSYQPSGVPGRTLIRPTDLYNPLQPVATLIATACQESIYVAPRLDVIQYFQSVPSLTPHRRDKEFYFQALLQNTADNTVGVVIPFYGRKSATYRFKNGTNHAISFGLFAVNFDISANGGRVVTTPVAVAPVVATAAVDGVIDTASRGVFDALVGFFDFTGVTKTYAVLAAMSFRVDVSDSPACAGSP